MGFEYGTYCLGCCRLLFVILFPVGARNVAVIAVLTALFFAEKSLNVSQQVALVAGVALLAYGAVVVFFPLALPITT